MINNNKIIAIIPARGGSKGIKNKNIRKVNNKHLIGYTIEEAKKSNYIDEIIVSTDSKKIAEVSKMYGANVPFLRPKIYASDTSKTIDAIVFTLEELSKQGNRYDILVLLQPTQPLRTVIDIDKCLEQFILYDKKSTVSVSKVEDHPILYRTINNDKTLNKMLSISSTCRRQDMPDYYKVNGCIYINSVDEVNNNLSFNDNIMGYIMSEEHSLDIDEYKDLYLFKYFLSKKSR